MPDAPVNRRPRATHAWARAPDNWYVEPQWVSQRLCEAEPFEGRTVDPCAGIGHVVLGAAAAGVTVEGLDLHGRVTGIEGGHDFWQPARCHGLWPCDNIIANPPFGTGARRWKGDRLRLEEQFLQLALERTRRKVALFLPTGWMHSEARGLWLEGLPLYRIYHLSPRPSCPPGWTILKGDQPGGDRRDFSWFVFLHGYQGAPTAHFLRRGDLRRSPDPVAEKG